MNENTTQPPYTPRMTRILDASASITASLGHGYIGTEHVLIALIDDTDGIAGHALEELGFADPTRRRITELISSDCYHTSDMLDEGSRG